METLRKRIFYKATHRGMRETDKIFGEFLIKNLNSLDKNLLGDLDKLLDLADVDLLNWILGREEVPKEFDNEIFRLLVSFKESL
tara:strand:- start:228 stop:479 length:252 start_codon:yes stop_codon:yes gene_type:complete